MCGIAGLIASEADRSADELRCRAFRMADALSHRGPDDRGAWVDPRRGVALGHRRLAILDLSSDGAQPMQSSSGRYTLVYNGEIYNFGELRKELEKGGHAFRGHSDTEVLLEAIEHWGFEAAVERTIGMFAFALWDAESSRLTLARDRIGKKPLYYGWCGRTFYFGSELKALRADPEFSTEVDRDALSTFVRRSYIPAPRSILRGIRKLPPGTSVGVSPRDVGHFEMPRSFWSARVVAERAEGERFEGSDDEATDALEALLGDAVARRMVADVPVGALLSGGIDSSTVVGVMQAQSDRPVRTFSIGYREREFDEAHHAKAVAKHLGTEHRELYVTADDALAVVPELARIYDEPFGDTSQIPTVLVSRLARQDVTVALSGDGGDELFGGYNKYFTCLRAWSRLSRFPRPARRLARRAATAIAEASRPQVPAGRDPAAVALARWRRWGGRLDKAADLLDARDPIDLFARRSQRVPRGGDFVVGAGEPLTTLQDPSSRARIREPLLQMMHLDLRQYLCEEILVKVDRASMSVGLEVRSPLLDHRLVEFAWSLPPAMRFRGGERKWLLRRLLDRYVPRELTDRPKMGFGVPLGAWLRGPLRDWAESLLDEDRLRQQGFLRADAVRRIWNEHQCGFRRWQGILWNFLAFESWLDT